MELISFIGNLGSQDKCRRNWKIEETTCGERKTNGEIKERNGR